MKRFFLSLLLTILLCAPAYAVTEQEIESYIIKKSFEVGFVKPGFPIGVIQVESRLGKVNYRIGQHGLYFLPGGIHKDFLKKWNLHNWKVCCDVAIETLFKRMVKKECNEVAVLKSYNTTGYTYAYRNEINKIKKQYNGETNGTGEAFQVAKVGKR